MRRQVWGFVLFTGVFALWCLLVVALGYWMLAIGFAAAYATGALASEMAFSANKGNSGGDQ